MQERFLREKRGSWCTPEAYLEATEVSVLPQRLDGPGHAVCQGHEGEILGVWHILFWVLVVAKAKEDNYRTEKTTRATEDA